MGPSWGNSRYGKAEVCDERNTQVPLDQVNDKSERSNDQWAAMRKVERLAEKFELMNKQLMIVTSDAGQGKTNFVCDLVKMC